MPCRTLEHPVAAHCLDQLRNEQTPPQQFRQLCHTLTSFLAIEATRFLPTVCYDLQTPLEQTTGRKLAQSVVVVAILRAGVGMVESIVRILPEVSVGYIGLERDEATAQARAYYCKLPPLRGRKVILVDPMLATGGSAIQAIEKLVEQGAEGIQFLCIVAAPEGVAAVETAFPEVEILCASVDRELNAKKYILPGLGDFGDRLYGTYE